MAYTKLDSTLTDSTIWQAPDTTRIVWITMLAMADQNGYVGASVPGLAGRARVPLQACIDAISSFEAPDPWSRTKEHEGRRIAPAEGGWVLLNHAKYRAIQSADDRRERSRIAMAALRQKRKSEAASGPHVNGKVHTLTKLTQAEAEADTEETDPAIAGSSSSFAEASPQQPLDGIPDKRAGPYVPPDCPHLKVLELWAKILPATTQHDPEEWRGARADHLRTRWRERAVAKRWTDAETGLQFFAKFFAYCSRSAFLTGKAPATPGRRPFALTLEWLVKPANWAKTIEGQFHEDHEA